jgi:hypothetical protein
MRIQTTSFTLIAAMALLGCGKATQPKPACRAQNAEYAAAYLEAQEMGGTCTDKVLTGEVVHMTYYRMNAAGGIPKLAIEPGSIADAVGEIDHWNEHHEMMQLEVTHEPEEFSLGSFKAAEPDEADICLAATLSEAGISTPEIPADMAMMSEAVPAATLKYKWSNVRFLTQPLSNAIHFGADLVRTDGDCVVKYKVSGINPVIHCGDGKQMVDTEEIDPATMMPVIDPATGKTKQIEVDDPESGKPKEELCDPSEVGAPEGSGLSPDFDYTCDEHTLLCLPNKAFPARVKK